MGDRSGSEFARTPFALPVYVDERGGIRGNFANLVFTLPPGFVPDEAAVLGFVAHPKGVPDHLKYTITINENVIPTERFGNTTTRSLLKIIPGRVLQGGYNLVTFSVDVEELGSIEDRIEFSNFVLWFQRRI